MGLAVCHTKCWDGKKGIMYFANQKKEDIDPTDPVAMYFTFDNPKDEEIKGIMVKEMFEEKERRQKEKSEAGARIVGEQVAAAIQQAGKRSPGRPRMNP